MTAGLESRPTAKTYDVESLMKLAWSGRIRIPHFQRAFRWQRHDVIRLFDSILRGYPVGSLLLWRRSALAERVTLGRLVIDGPATEQALYVVDGQQRIASLANALDPGIARDAELAIAYDLEVEQFVANPVAEEPTILPLPVLFDLTKVLGWFGRYPEVQSYVTRANEITQTLRQFQIPAYEVVQDDPKVLQDIFDRMNNYGKRLNRAEVFSALFAQDENVKDRLAFSRIAGELDDDLGFGVMEDKTIMTAILARRGPDAYRPIRGEFDARNVVEPRAGRTAIDFPDEDQETAYRLGQDAMRRAIEFLQDEAGVPHASFLAYGYLFFILTRFFAHFPDPDTRSLTLLRRWYWRAAVNGQESFKGSAAAATRQLGAAVKPGNLHESVREMLRLVERPDTSLPDLRRFRSNEAATRIVLCSWWDARPRSFDTGEPIDREELSACLTDRLTALDAVRDIVPRRYVPLEYRLWSADRMLLPQVEDDTKSVQDLLVDRAFELDDAVWPEFLDSHLITPEALTELVNGRTVEFLVKRQQALEAQLRTFLSRMCEWKFESTPPLSQFVVEDLNKGDDDPT